MNSPISLTHPHVVALRDAAARCHAEVNQKYDGYLPYEFHLRLTASFAARFIHLLGADEAEAETIYAGAYFHDSMEDARLTYNDLTKLLTELKEQHGLLLHVEEAVEAVYALTNEKGRNRAERANERYYAGIRSTRFAPFLKMCDRLANVCYSTQFSPQQKMAQIYAEEMPHFLQAIGKVPQEMVETAYKLLENKPEL